MVYKPNVLHMREKEFWELEILKSVSLLSLGYLSLSKKTSWDVSTMLVSITLPRYTEEDTRPNQIIWFGLGSCTRIFYLNMKTSNRNYSNLKSKSVSEAPGCCLDPQKYMRKLLLLAPSESKSKKQKYVSRIL